MKIKDLLNLSTQELKQFSSSSRLDCELLLCHVLNKPKVFLYAEPAYELTTAELTHFQKLLSERQQGKPIAYILGKQGFWNLELKVTFDVLIPRPETEGLVEVVLANFPDNNPCQVLDLGTGSGAIAIALAVERPLWHITAIDISATAIELAKENAAAARAINIQFLVGNWFENLETKLYDCIVTNPPYIAETDADLAENVRNYEPKLALIAGNTGLECIAVIANKAKNYLKAGGLLVFEHGFKQASAIQQLLASEGYKKITTAKDYNGLDRITTATFFLL